ncbi:hypothetical protein LWS69_33510, partial [Bordetella hinzii]|nr:hypothetical protein [Bordetella hinzii]
MASAWPGGRQAAGDGKDARHMMSRCVPQGRRGTLLALSRKPENEIRNPQSAIRNPQSAIECVRIAAASLAVAGMMGMPPAHAADG